MSATLAALVRAEAAKLARQPATWILSVVLVGYLLVVGVSFYALLTAPEMEGFDRETFLAPMRTAPLAFTAGLFSGTASIVLVVLAATMVGQEFSRGTLRTLLLTGVTRPRFALAKILVVVIIALVAALAGMLFSVLALLALGSAIGERLLDLDAADALYATFGLTIVFAGWGILAITATLVRGSLGMGIGITMGTLIVGDVASGLLASTGPAGELATRLLPNAAFSAIALAPPAAHAWLWIVPNLAFYLVLLPTLAIRRFGRIDVVAATRG